jgi:opacity protein-like surface antigen
VKLLFSMRRCGVALATMVVWICAALPALAQEGESKGSDESGESSKKEASEGDEGDSADDGEKKDEGDEGKDEGGAEKDESAAKKNEAFGHGGQLGLRLGLVLGYRMVLRYDDSPYCRAPNPAKAANNQPKFCGHGAPLALQAGLSWALVDWLEPFIWGRFGLADEPQTDTEPVLMFGAGTRIYTMSDAPFKIFFEPAIGLEFEEGRGTPEWQANNPEYPNDFVIHLTAGPTLDFSRNVGAYVTAGVTMSIIRALASSLEAELGIQGRY